jgi:hypothetical protein
VEDGKELKILRDNMPFGHTSDREFGRVALRAGTMLRSVSVPSNEIRGTNSLHRELVPTCNGGRAYPLLPGHSFCKDDRLCRSMRRRLRPLHLARRYGGVQHRGLIQRNQQNKGINKWR